MELAQELEIIKDDSLSIDDLTRLQAEGYSVLRSAHVGNFAPYNLSLAAAGIPMLCVDHTVTGIDRNYLPETLQLQTGNVRLAAFGRLVCRAEVDEGSPVAAVKVQADYVDEFHLAATRNILPGAELYTNTEYLRNNASVAAEIADVALGQMPNSFNRLVLADGTTERRTVAAPMVARYGILQLNENPRAEAPAVLLPNIVNILTNFVIEELSFGRSVQYHLSGPDMIRYIDGLLPDMRRLYGLVRKNASFGSQLPPTLTVCLVPTAAARFATTLDRKDGLDDLLATYEIAESELVALEGRRKVFFCSSDAANDMARQTFIQTVKRQQAAVETELAEQFAKQPELFVEAGSEGFISQYDVAVEGGLYVAPVNKQRTMAELAAMTARLKRIGMRLLR